MDHAADAFRTVLMIITRHVLNEPSRHPESRGDLTILLSHIVLGCKFVASAVNKAGLAKLIACQARPTSRWRSRRSWTCSPTRCSSMPFDTPRCERPHICSVFLCPRRTRRLRSWTQSSVGSTVSALIPWMAPPTSTAASPSERFNFTAKKVERNAQLGRRWSHYLTSVALFKARRYICCMVYSFTYILSFAPQIFSRQEVLQPGKDMIAAGYCMYGSSCTLVLSTGNCVNGFTLDPSLEEFIMTHLDIEVCCAVRQMIFIYFF